MPLLTLGRKGPNHRLGVLVPGCLGAHVALTLADDGITPLAPGHVTGLGRRGLLGRRADRLGVDQVLGAVHPRHPAPVAGAALPVAGPGHPGRGRLLVLVGDGGKLPLRVLPLQLGLVNEAEDPVTASANDTRIQIGIVVTKMMISDNF